jgi:alpha-L-fucosidase
MNANTHPELVAGMRVGSARYILRRLLGQGSVGAVWLAWDSKLEQEVALKVLPESLLQDPNIAERLRSETRRSLQLAHPNIVRTYDFVRDQSLTAIVTEYVDGWSLWSLRVDKPQQRFGVEEIRPWLQQLCAALDCAHQQAGLLHLDLKPSNLLLSRNGEIKVSDFGISGGLQRLNAPLDARRMAERLGFMSPQQAMGEKPAVADDIYSLGATVFALLTGTPPFYTGEVLAQVRELPAPSMTARLTELGIEEDIPYAWEEAVAACLAKDPTKRPRTVLEVLGLLQRPESPPPVASVAVPVEAAAEARDDSAPSPALANRASRKILAGAMVALLTLGLGVWYWGAVEWATRSHPAAENADRLAWFNDARFGMFIHWGLYSVPAGEWEGKQNYAEWIQLQAKIPNARYEKFAAEFNPVKFDAKEWVRVAKDAGMKYLVITAKHHDGFCMYDTKLTDYNIVKATPFKRDPMKELGAACHEAGLTFCFYYSVPDWHHPQFPARFSQRGFHGDPNPDADLEQYAAYLKGQVRELLSGYGPIGILWFDGGGSFKQEGESGRAGLLHAQEVIDLIHELQPRCLVNNRLGLPADYGTPEQKIPGASQTNSFEVCMTLNRHWGYNRHDNDWKSSRQIIQNLVDIASKGGNYLLNVGPTSEGLMPAPTVERLKEVGQWMKANGEGIYGTTASPLKELVWGRCTEKVTVDGTTLYLHVFEWPPDGKLLVPGLRSEVHSAVLLVTGGKLATTADPAGVIITLPRVAPDSACSTVALRIKGALAVE